MSQVRIDSLGLGRLAAATALFMAAGCGMAPDGVVRGQANPCPGAGGLRLTAISARVRVVHDHRPVHSLLVAPPYRFVIRLAPGLYTIEAPGDAAVSVQVRSGTTVQATMFPDCGAQALAAALPS